MKDVTLALQQKLTRHERMLHLAKQCQAIKDHEAWKCIEDRLKAERQEMLEGFVRDDLDERQRDLIRARAQTIDLFLAIPGINAKTISEHERAVTHLRASLQDRKTRGLDQEIPGWKEHEAAMAATFKGLM